MRRSVLATWLFVAISLVAPTAFANGRAPGTSTINFQRGHESTIAAGMTFGLLISQDNGATWQWTCEDNLFYTGMYDPHYVWTSGGPVLETSFHGLRISTDNACTFGLSSIAMDVPPNAMSIVYEAPNGDIYATGTDAADGHIYRSIDGGLTFPVATTPEMSMPKDWRETLVVAPSDPNRVYLSGYRVLGAKVFLMYKSTDRGVTFTTMTPDLTQFTTVNSSAIDIVGVDPVNADVLYARVTVVNNNIGDDIYRSDDAGVTWTKKLSQNDSLHAFVVRSNGDLVAGTPTLGAWVSHDKGDTWDPLVNPPHLNCLVENAAHEVWGCTLNYGSNQIAPDGFGIMKTTDLATWTGVLHDQDIQGPVSCDPSSIQETQCVANLWCGVRNQLGITANPTGCPDLNADVPMVKTPPKGCCDVGDDGAPVWICLASLIGVILMRHPRRRARRAG